LPFGGSDLDQLLGTDEDDLWGEHPLAEEVSDEAHRPGHPGLVLYELLVLLLIIQALIDPWRLQVRHERLLTTVEQGPLEIRLDAGLLHVCMQP